MAQTNTTLVVKDGSGTSQTLSAQQDSGNSSYVVPKHAPVDSAGVQLFGDTAAAADAGANPTICGAKCYPMLFNGTTWDRARSGPGTTGVQAVSSDGTKSTFGTGASLFTLPATPTDVVQLIGSVTKTVRLKRIMVSGQATTAKQWPLSIIRRAAAITGGTPVSPAITKFDITNDATPTAVVSHYTALGSIQAANPASSVLAIWDLTLTAPATNAYPVIMDFTTRTDKAFILRGVADCIVLNLGGGALTAGEKLSYYFEWEEDAS